ncbi:chloramphenicol acetyltransferase [Flavobacterium suncheonense]|uniref:Chloramphenicol acetyltransferase n=1 Tax=Flavobacterium suncheonense GH29-5 = DSM 17707 TaxID=1121899 RepID=A0A0A2MFU5_9FLAO|nr:chloramphenicol acetyltransferase [Flavobacterium suncheonense]KGO90323.1 chloramphenicol acetyltransferase [Flavobacterium suncheonense GH29-5 = DSM 17707]
MKQKLDLNTWNRKTHFEFFSNFEEPFYGLTFAVDCTKAYETAKAKKISFFIYYLHKTLAAVNEIENFRYRILDGEVFLYDTINASPTIMREDKTFGFALTEYFPEIEEFNEKTILEIKRIQNTKGLFTRDFTGEYNLIHFSSIPWVDFTSVSHARSFTFPDSCPKISFGKMTETDGKKSMPMSVHVHHGLVDGYHVGLFAETFQKLMDL